MKKFSLCKNREKINNCNPSKTCQIPLLALDAFLTNAERVLTIQKLGQSRPLSLYLHWNSTIKVKPKN